jgi:hypothetical protein
MFDIVLCLEQRLFVRLNFGSVLCLEQRLFVRLSFGSYIYFRCHVIRCLCTLTDCIFNG